MDRVLIYTCDICQKEIPASSPEHLCIPQRDLSDIVHEETQKVMECDKTVIPFGWESIGYTASRAKIIGGWIVRVYSADGKGGGVCFVEDKKWKWEIE